MITYTTQVTAQYDTAVELAELLNNISGTPLTAPPVVNELLKQVTFTVVQQVDSTPEATQ